jgi:hypothetical protein
MVEMLTTVRLCDSQRSIVFCLTDYHLAYVVIRVEHQQCASIPRIRQ